MKFYTLPLVILFSLPLALSAQALEANPTLNKSITFTALASYVYKDDFGGLTPGYGAMITYSYLLSEDTLLGINLLRYQIHPGDNPGLMTFSYGFTFQHFWKNSWGDLGPWKPYLSYSILLNQGVQAGVDGRGMAHNTRLAFGTELATGEHHRWGLEALWNYATYGFFNQDTLSYQTLGLGISYRYIF